MQWREDETIQHAGRWCRLPWPRDGREPEDMEVGEEGSKEAYPERVKCGDKPGMT